MAPITAVAPQEVVVLGSLRNIARLDDAAVAGHFRLLQESGVLAGSGTDEIGGPQDRLAMMRGWANSVASRKKFQLRIRTISDAVYSSGTGPIFHNSGKFSGCARRRVAKSEHLSSIIDEIGKPGAIDCELCHFMTCARLIYSTFLGMFSDQPNAL